MDTNEKKALSITSLSHGLVHVHELSIPIFISIWIANWDLSAGTIGLIVSVGYALFGLGALPSGILTNQIGARTMMVTCLSGIGMGFLILSFVFEPVGLLIAMVVWGLSASIHHPASLSLISQFIRQRGEGFGYHGMAGAVGIAGGPFLTTVCLIWFTWEMTCLLLSLPAFIGAILALQLPNPEDYQHSETASRDESRVSTIESIDEFFHQSRNLFSTLFILLLVTLVLEGLYYRGIITFMENILRNLQLPLPQIITKLNVDSGQILYTLIFPAGILGQFVGGKLSDRIRPERGIAITLILLSLIAISFIFVIKMNVIAILISGLFLGFFLFMIQPLYQALVANMTSPDHRGLAYGYTFLCIFGLGSPGAALAGWLIQTYGPNGLFISLSVIAIGASSIVFSFFWGQDNDLYSSAENPH